MCVSAFVYVWEFVLQCVCVLGRLCTVVCVVWRVCTLVCVWEWTMWKREKYVHVSYNEKRRRRE